MDCRLIRGELVAFHFGTVEPEARAQVEAHLCECAPCLQAYLALKREIETSEAAPRPSEAARLRLRRAVAAEVAQKRPRREPSWWRRPLAFGFAAAAAAAVMLSVVAVRAQLQQMAEYVQRPPPSHGSGS